MSIHEDIDTALDALERLSIVVRGGNTLGAMEAVATFTEVIADVATTLIERGVKEGLTLKAMADALGVPASALRGAKKAFTS